jgi:Ca2+-binding EF-hand superfamily protein
VPHFLIYLVSRQEIKKLYTRFKRLDKDHVGTISKQELLAIPELVMNPLAPRVVAMFCNTANDNHVNFRQFVQTLSPLSAASSIEDKIKCTYNMDSADQRL